MFDWLISVTDVEGFLLLVALVVIGVWCEIWWKVRD
jgi:hypothetical protein